MSALYSHTLYSEVDPNINLNINTNRNIAFRLGLNLNITPNINLNLNLNLHLHLNRHSAQNILSRELMWSAHKALVTGPLLPSRTKFRKDDNPKDDTSQSLKG